MAEIIKPILNRKLFESTSHRMYTMFQPIQETKEKKSDFIAFIATPVIDYLVMDTLFAIDASIHIINATASLLKAAYLWTLHQQDTDELIDAATDRELSAFIHNVEQIINLTVAQFLNLIFSTASLITRPAISVLEAICEDDEISEMEKGRNFQF